MQGRTRAGVNTAGIAAGYSRAGGCAFRCARAGASIAVVVGRLLATVREGRSALVRSWPYERASLRHREHKSLVSQDSYRVPHSVSAYLVCLR